MSAMTASERRQQIARLLSASQAPISATTLSQELGVSRQIIVGDIALLRAAGQEITATARGYVIPAQNGLLRRIACMHSAGETRDELDAMVDCGCTVVDVIVEHPVYGQLTAPLHLSSRLDVDQFMKRMDGAAPLSQLRQTLEAVLRLPFAHYLSSHAPHPLPKAQVAVHLHHLDQLRLEDPSRPGPYGPRVCRSQYREQGSRSVLLIDRGLAEEGESLP